jgi:hypothetical protein
MFQISSGRLGEDKSLSSLFGKRNPGKPSQTNHHHHHHHHVQEGLRVFRVR